MWLILPDKLSGGRCPRFGGKERKRNWEKKKKATLRNFFRTIAGGLRKEKKKGTEAEGRRRNVALPGQGTFFF